MSSIEVRNNFSEHIRVSGKEIISVCERKFECDQKCYEMITIVLAVKKSADICSSAKT